MIIADFDHYDVQQLLKESRLLITDFSSVAFDFGYMRKPLIYYQFDYEEYRKGHYREGYFNYETMGFGEVVRNEDELVEVTLAYISSQFSVKEIYKEKMVSFFPLRDTHNCDRIFEEIQKL